MPLGADAEKTAAATFAGGVFPTQKTASPSPSTLSVRSACALNRDHVALRAGCLIHANRLWYSSSTTSSMLTTRSRAASLIRATMALYCEASTPERTREAIRSRVENAGISSRPLCRTSSSSATFTKSAVCAFTGAATHIAASVTARASPGLCLSPRRSRTADGQRSSLRPESASGTVPAASPA
ncbi:hypothetical protein PV733_44515 [Streptomyces europaeiscabiei]|nr:hypothetical protein [Streptomyces europaeiscabiei]MDX2526361.1 hypothetical protein [Streptomyces europaeiscabiei]MDX2769371.1 hypothetical protein [Streptomyces europaeiscabiei]MDX3665781.1 hypothetical protein [Streptomyces europaeiscabiei]MDX3715843.1 hypothetical protein [Streptomyces europaeiscabiei]MDX3778932.1 hypothetical protein [Streptomyces europaeiscabiei]